MTLFAKAYAVVLGILALLAWYSDLTLLHSPREHLAADMYLAFASLPASLSLGLLPNSTPSLAQLTWLTLCAAAQAGIVFFISRRLRRQKV